MALEAQHGDVLRVLAGETALVLASALRLGLAGD